MIFNKRKSEENNFHKETGRCIKKVLEKCRVSFVMILIASFCVLSIEGCALSDNSKKNENVSEIAKAKSSSSEEATSEVIKLGDEGKYCFQVSIVYPDESKEIYEIKTNEENVGAALYGVGLIDDPVYFSVVNNVEANWEKDGAYWSVFEAGDFATKGISEYKTSEKIDKLELRYTK